VCWAKHKVSSRRHNPELFRAFPIYTTVLSPVIEIENSSLREIREEGAGGVED